MVKKLHTVINKMTQKEAIIARDMGKKRMMELWEKHKLKKGKK